MPTYDYVCRACNASHELFHSITAPPEKVCPSCAKEALERLISAPAPVHLQGSGWYRDGYASKR